MCIWNGSIHYALNGSIQLDSGDVPFRCWQNGGQGNQIYLLTFLLTANVVLSNYQCIKQSHFYRAIPRRARYWQYCHSKSSVRPSVTVRDCDHTGCKTFNTISRLISIGFFAVCRPQRRESTRKGRLPRFNRNRSNVLEKVALGVLNVHNHWNGWRLNESYY